ncbi:MAG: hypothetical protein VX589_19015, partial [Myxococcota bacterium]|nr:hypothetical protein [Myxococcota bacterium]
DECSLACENLAGCLPISSPLAVFRNRDRCMDLCLTREGPSDETWTCRAQSMDCNDFNRCGERTDASACDPVGENAGRCLAAICEPARPVQDKMVAGLTQICIAQLQAGQVQPITIRDEDARMSCERGLAHQYVTYLTQPNEMDERAGSLASFCRSGAGVEVSVCEAACEYLGPCIPDSSPLVPLRNRASCEFFCLTDPNTVDATWMCLSEATECNQAGPCFRR